MAHITELNTVKACIFGHAVGDALGVPVEFESRTRRDADPVTGLRGYGTFAVPAGAWSDDTSMTLCALDALSWEAFLWESVMVNFGKWYYRDEFTPTGVAFDIGHTCAAAIDARFAEKKDLAHCAPRDERSNGNGSLMRIIPFVLYDGENLPVIEQASALTHAHRRSQIACGIYSLVLTELIRQKTVGAYRDGLEKARTIYGGEAEWQHFALLTEIESRTRESIRSSGYVVDTLEAALWCLVTTDSYRDCVLKAVNLGEDTDSVAAVAGGLAGALYGLDAIPREWLDGLQRRDFIEQLCEKAVERWKNSGQ